MQECKSPTPSVAMVDKGHLVMGGLGETKIRIITIIHSHIMERFKANGQGELMANQRLRPGSVVSAKGMATFRRIV